MRHIALVFGAWLLVGIGVAHAAAPVPVTAPADLITQTSARLNGTVNTNGQAATTSFYYGIGTPTQVVGAGIKSGPNVSVSAPVNGLTCNTTYSFYLFARNPAKEDGQGATLNFTTAACGNAGPEVTTQPATSISLTGARLNGSIDPNGVATTGYFDYGLSADNLSTTTTFASVGQGSSPVPVFKDLTTLTCGTTYFFRARAVATQEVSGQVLNFSTSPCLNPPPDVAIASPTAISGTGATFNGTVNPSGTATNVFFDYGLTVENLAQTASDGAAGSGLSDLPVSTPVTGLTCGTTYYVRLRAVNGGGTSTTPPISFATAACAGAPGASTSGATAITDTTATLNGLVDPNSLATTAYFDYGLAGGALDRSVTFGPVGSGTSDVPVASAVADLLCGQQYDFRVRATSSAGTTNASTSSFFTLACSANAPSVSTSSAQSISAVGATLRAQANPNGVASTLYWEYGTSAQNLDQVLLFGGIGAGINTQLFSKALTGLTCGKTYWYRARAENPNGVNFGDVLSFNTSACPNPLPTVTTTAATAITADGATLNGTVNPNNSATTGLFDYGLAPGNLDQLATFGAIAAGSSPVPYSKAVTGLLCATTYYFRARATNGAGPGNGTTLTFTTGGCPPNAPFGATDPASDVGPTSATLNARVSANNPMGNASVYFDYGTSPGLLDKTVNFGFIAGFAIALATSPVSDLSCNTTYYFRVRVVSSNGTTFGSVLSFTTGSCGPQCTVDYPLFCGGGDGWANNNPGSTNTVTQYTCSGQQFNFSTGPEYTYIFQSPDPVQATVTMSGLGADLDLFMLTAPAGFCSGDNCLRISAAGGATNETVSFPAKANTTYYVVVDGYAGATSSYTLNVSCTPVTLQPLASTVGSSAVSETLATVSGTADPRGGETTVYFDYGTLPGLLDQTVTYGSIGSGVGDVPISFALSGLTCGTTYYYRIRADNAAGTTLGTILSFQTNVCGGVCDVDYSLDCAVFTTDNWSTGNSGSTDNKVSEYTCGNQTYGNLNGREYTYTFTTPTTKAVSLNLFNFSQDLDLFAVTTPGGACSGLNCLQVSQRIGTTPENITFLAQGGTTYNFVVDGFGTATSTYSVSLECKDPVILKDSFENPPPP